MPSFGINFRFSRLSMIALYLLPLLTLSSPATARGAETGMEAVVTNKYANIRGGPGTRYTRIGRAYRGERFPVTDTRPQWCKIIFKGREAWVYSSLVRLETPAVNDAEIDRLNSEIEVLNQRLERVLEKIESANTRISEKLEEQEARSSRKKGRGSVGPGLPDVSPAWMFVPGGPRLDSGDRWKGLALMGAAAGCLGAGVHYHSQYTDKRDEYRGLGPGAPLTEFDRLYKDAQDKKDLSQVFFYAAAGVLAFNVIDYFFLLPDAVKNMPVRASASDGGERINLSLGHQF